MQTYNPNQILIEPGLGGVASLESATGNGPLLPIAPLPSNLPQRRDKSVGSIQ